MKEDVLDIIIYLFEHYMLEHVEEEPDEQAIMHDLSQAGFHRMTIDRAFDWLEDLAIMCEAQEAAEEIASENDIEEAKWAPSETAVRIYHPEEAEKLDANIQGLLLSLEQGGVLNPVSREMVIDRLMALDSEDIDTEHVKWVVLMVLTNCSGAPELPGDFAESLVYSEQPTHLN